MKGDTQNIDVFFSKLSSSRAIVFSFEYNRDKSLSSIPPESMTSRTPRIKRSHLYRKSKSPPPFPSPFVPAHLLPLISHPADTYRPA